MKEEVARIVKNCLHEYFATGRIGSRDDFKHLARDITHKWCAKLDGTRDAKSVVTDKLRARIKKHVAKQFERSFIYVRGSSSAAVATSE